VRWPIAFLLVASPAHAEDIGVSRLLAHDGGSFAQATTEYTDNLHLDVSAEARVWGPLRVVASVAISDEARPGAGIGVDVFEGGTVYLRYKAEGFSEPEGELEAMLAAGRQLDGVRLAGMLAYGQDPEGNERDGEAGASIQLGVTDTVYAGVGGRYRDALGSTKETLARDALAGAVGTWRVGRIAVGALVGLAMTETRGMPRKFGTGGALSVGALF
jgi:hypothetical protein